MTKRRYSEGILEAKTNIQKVLGSRGQRGIYHSFSDELPKIGDVSVLCRVAETIKELYLCSEDYINDIVEEAVTTLTTILSA